MYNIGSKPLSISFGLFKFCIVWSTKLYNQTDAEHTELWS